MLWIFYLLDRFRYNNTFYGGKFEWVYRGKKGSSIKKKIALSNDSRDRLGNQEKIVELSHLISGPDSKR